MKYYRDDDSARDGGWKRNLLEGGSPQQVRWDCSCRCSEAARSVVFLLLHSSTARRRKDRRTSAEKHERRREHAREKRRAQSG